MKNSRARKHYLRIVDAVGTYEERNVKPRPLGFAPRLGRMNLIPPQATPYQDFEDWLWEDEA